MSSPFRPTGRSPRWRDWLQGQVNRGLYPDIKYTFIAGAYQITGGLGSGKSYNATRFGLTLAALTGRTFISNYHLTPASRYALRSENLPIPETYYFSMHSPDVDKVLQINNSVIVIDECLYYSSVGRLKNKLISVVVHARKRNQVVLLLSQAPLTRQWSHVIRYKLACTYWFHVGLFQVKLQDPTPRSQRVRLPFIGSGGNNLRVWNIWRQHWWSKAYDSWEDFDESAVTNLDFVQSLESQDSKSAPPDRGMKRGKHAVN